MFYVRLYHRQNQLKSNINLAAGKELGIFSQFIENNKKTG
jgi:hypothetical protein